MWSFFKKARKENLFSWESTTCCHGRDQFLWCMKDTQLCLTLCDPMDCSLPGSSICGILQARILQWVAISFSRGSSQPRDWSRVSRIAGRRFTLWATRGSPKIYIIPPVNTTYTCYWSRNTEKFLQYLMIPCKSREIAPHHTFLQRTLSR